MPRSPPTRIHVRPASLDESTSKSQTGSASDGTLHVKSSPSPSFVSANTTLDGSAEMRRRNCNVDDWKRAVTSQQPGAEKSSNDTSKAPLASVARLTLE